MTDRDLVGYANNPPRVTWPNGARVAVSLVVNYEEGSENLLQDGVGRRESWGDSMSPVPPDQRDLANESMFEYGSRVGVWRFRHFKVVARIIGEDVVGTQGTPVELLAGLIKHKMFPELWSVRTDLTELAKESD